MPSGDHGFALIETLVSAVMLAVVSLAVLSGIDGASGSAARERSRSVAASLAEQDQERMRAMSASQLTDYAPGARTVRVDQIDYEVVSRSEWIRDDTGGTTSCTNNSAQVDYLRISTEVRSNVVGTNIEPVSMASLVAPPVSNARGTLGVQVNDRNNVGIAGKTVQAKAAGGGTFTEQTNELGCAIFSRIPVDHYVLSLTETGGVDPFGNPDASTGADVLNGTVQLVTIKYDGAATVNWSVRTNDPYSGAAITPSHVTKVSAVNGEERDLLRQFTASPATSLFPFLMPYSFFTGGCAHSNPATAIVPADPDYFETNIGAVATEPNQLHAVEIYQPPLAVRVRYSTTAGTYVGNGLATNNWVGATAIATLRPDATDDTPCRESYTLMATTRPDGSKGYLSHTSPGYDPGLPYGVYDVCVMVRNDSNRRRYTSTYHTVDNRKIGGAAAIEVVADISGAPTPPAGISATDAPCPT
jgi:type II secretory pathway pseudopilin PulG